VKKTKGKGERMPVGGLFGFPLSLFALLLLPFLTAAGNFSLVKR
jgi:hypothetical protein